MELLVVFPMYFRRLNSYFANVCNSNIVGEGTTTSCRAITVSTSGVIFFYFLGRVFFLVNEKGVRDGVRPTSIFFCSVSFVGPVTFISSIMG